MNTATVLGLAASLIDAAAFAAWVGALTSVSFRVTARSPAWRHAVALAAAVALSTLTYFACLMALGQVELLSGREGRPPTWGGVVVLATLLGFGLGAPWGMLRHAWWARAVEQGDADPGAFADLSTARRLAIRIFVPFALLGLLVFAPRVARNEAVTHATGGAIVTLLLAVVLGTLFYTFIRHLKSILKLAAGSVLVGVPILTVMFIVNGMKPGEALLFSVGSALMWGPVFGFAAWAILGTHNAGFRIGGDGMIHPTPLAQPAADLLPAPKPARDHARGKQKKKRKSARKR